MTTDAAAIRAELARIDRVARLLDSRFRLPGTSFRFGLDTVVGLIPGVGDTLTALPAAWILWKAHQLGVPRPVLARMGVNAGLDYVIGSVPILGDLFDAGFKANLRNARLLQDHLQTRLAGLEATTAAKTA